jgi:hypothetical protein
VPTRLTHITPALAARAVALALPLRQRARPDLGETCTSVSASSTNCESPGNADINDSLSRANVLASVVLIRRAGRRPLRWQLGRRQPLTRVPRRLCASPITGRDGDVAHSLWSVKTLTWSKNASSGLPKSQLHKAFATANHRNSARSPNSPRGCAQQALSRAAHTIGTDDQPRSLPPPDSGRGDRHRRFAISAM